MKWLLTTCVEPSRIGTKYSFLIICLNNESVSRLLVRGNAYSQTLE